MLVHQAGFGTVRWIESGAAPGATLNLKPGIQAESNENLRAKKRRSALSQRGKTSSPAGHHTEC
jgi:hypothetical protein